MSGPAARRWLPLASLLLGACAEKAGPSSWAVHHAAAEATPGGLRGYQTWEFFTEDWSGDREADTHVCARVQALAGVEAAPLSGCTECDVTVAVRADEVSTDCEGEEGTKAGFGSMTHFAIGPLPEQLEGDAPYPGETLGWYLSWDGVIIEPYGFVWNEALDRGEPVLVTGWDEGARYVFWPAYAWDL